MWFKHIFAIFEIKLINLTKSRPRHILGRHLYQQFCKNAEQDSPHLILINASGTTPVDIEEFEKNKPAWFSHYHYLFSTSLCEAKLRTKTKPKDSHFLGWWSTCTKAHPSHLPYFYKSSDPVPTIPTKKSCPQMKLIGSCTWVTKPSTLLWFYHSQCHFWILQTNQT